jgi:hypothetical protein
MSASCYHPEDAFCETHCDCACELCCLERLVAAGKACMTCRSVEGLQELSVHDVICGLQQAPGPRVICSECLYTDHEPEFNGQAPARTLSAHGAFNGCKDCWQDVCRCDFEEEEERDDQQPVEDPCDCGACEEHDGREESWF